MRSVWLWSYKEKEVADLKTGESQGCSLKDWRLGKRGGLRLSWLLKQLKGKGRKCQLHAHLCDFMGEESRNIKSKSTHMILLVKTVKAVKFIRLDTLRETHGSVSDPECRVSNHLHPLGSSTSNAGKGLMDVNNKLLLTFLLLLFSTVSLNSFVFGLQSSEQL